MMNNIGRLSDLNIVDDIIRADFYQHVVAHIQNPTADTITYTIRIDEEYRHDLVAYRVYAGITELRWIVGLVCGVDDEAEPLPVGETFNFPTPVWIRREMRSFIEGIN